MNASFKMKNYLMAVVLGASFMLASPVYSQVTIKFEEETLKLYAENKGNAYDLLNAINYNDDLYNKGKKVLDEHINDLKSKGILTKPLKKQIQIIYKTTHAKFLKKYDIKAFFNNIFENGQYNCVSASALYALIFNEFNINYSIRETPTHVYIIADTLGLQTLIESTLPGSGAINFNEKFKKDFVDYLNSNKIISDLEYNNSTTDELFKEFYSKDKTINLFELAAIQYYNKGVFLMEDQKYAGATSYLKNALAIYPSNSIKYTHYAALQNAMVNDITKKNYDGKLFGQVLNSSTNDSTITKLVSDYFENVSYELCVTAPDINRFNTFYSDILSQCAIDNIPNNILQKYHYFKAYNYGVNGIYSKALAEIKASFILNNDNLLIRDLAVNIATKHLFIESNYKEQIDSLDYYFEQLPFLLDNKLFQQQYVYYFMKVISDCYKFNAPLVGKEYYNKFLEAIEKYNINSFSEEHISFGFSIMAIYFLDKNNFTKGLQIVNKGLELSPNSLSLKQLKSEIGNVKKAAKSEMVYVNTYIDPNQELCDKVNKYFPGKWKAQSILMEEMEQKLNSNETFEFEADKKKNCTYIHNGKAEKGKWAYRPKSRCIYFVPDSNKDNYKVFKIKEVSSDKIVLLPYKDQKSPSPYKYVLKPFN